MLLNPIVAKGFTDAGFEPMPLCDGFQVAMKPVIPDHPFGQISDGQISLSGYIVPGEKLTWIWNRKQHTEHGQALNRISCMTTYAGPTTFACNFDDIKDYEDRKRRLMGLPLFLKIPSIDLLPLIYWKNSKSPRESSFEGLLVVRDARSNCFRRCGYFCSDRLGIRNKMNDPKYLFQCMQENNNIVLI
jgi:hypothetical protein